MFSNRAANFSKKLFQNTPGPVLTKGLSQGLGLNVEIFVSNFCRKPAKTFVLGLGVFKKNLGLVLGLAKGST